VLSLAKLKKYKNINYNNQTKINVTYSLLNEIFSNLNYMDISSDNNTNNNNNESNYININNNINIEEENNIINNGIVNNKDIDSQILLDNKYFSSLFKFDDYHYDIELVDGLINVKLFIFTC
jgi:hypothetical protein